MAKCPKDIEKGSFENREGEECDGDEW